MTKKQYSASLTGEPLQFFESKVVAELMLTGLSYAEIKQKVYDENLFNYKTKKSIHKRVASVYRRLKDLDDFLVDVIVNGPSTDAKAVLLYSLMKTNRLFSEFMIEVIRKKFREMDYLLTMKDLNIFFERKRDQSEKVAGWKEYTFYRLSRVLFKILEESQLIYKKNNDYDLRKLMISYSLERYFIAHKQHLFLECIGY